MIIGSPGINHSYRTEKIASNLGYNIIQSELEFSEINVLFEIPGKEWKQLFLHLLILIPIEFEIQSTYCVKDNKNLILNYSVNKSLSNNVKSILRFYDQNNEKKIPTPGSIITSKNRGNVKSTIDFIITINGINVNQISKIEIKFIHTIFAITIFEQTVDFDPVYQNEPCETDSYDLLNTLINNLENDLEDTLLGIEFDPVYKYENLESFDESSGINDLVQQLNQLKEDEFIDYLSILLRKMGFKNVNRNTSHGSQEKGLDIPLFYYEDIFNKINYYGVQAKAKKIHRNTYKQDGGNDSQIKSQINVAFSSDFVDIRDERKKKVDFIILANSKSIDPDARTFIKEEFENKVIIFNDFELAVLFIRHNIQIKDS